MKKLVLLVLAAVCVLGAQAAAVNWKTTGSLVNNKTVYAFLESDRSAVTALLTAATSADAFTSSLTSSGLAYGQANGAASAAQGSLASSALTTGSNYNLFFVTIGGSDPAYRITSDTVTATAFSETSPSTSYPALAVSSSNLSSSVKFSSQTPEPTSGLLMLVGLGALALRRKQK